jgi:hypothetical protein
VSNVTYPTTSTDPFVSEVLARLPADIDLDLLARQHKALLRSRAIPDAASLLHGLLAYATTASSLRALGVWGVLTDVADLAPSSWLERLRNASSFLRAIAASLLALPRSRWLSQSFRGRVLLVDASWLRLHGGTGNDYRLHLAFDLLNGQLDQLVLTDGSGAEQLSHFSFRAGDLSVMDAGYGYRDRLAHLQDSHADAITRIYPPTFPLEEADGQRLDLHAWLHHPGRDQRSRLAYYRHNDTRYAVRVLAYRLTAPQRERAQRRLKNRARKRQRPLSEVVQSYADWIVLVTTLIDSQAWPDAALWQVYGARWQVELVFKRLKQLLDFGQLRSRTAQSATAVVWARLVVWLLYDGQRGDLKRSLQAVAEPHPSTYPGQRPACEAVVSSWVLDGLLLETLRGAIRGSWTLATIRACLPRLRRFLTSHPRANRVHQETEVVAWLSGQRYTPRRPLPNAV